MFLRTAGPETKDEVRLSAGQRRQTGAVDCQRLPRDHYAIGRGQWMVKASSTAKEVAKNLGILDSSDTISGSYVVRVNGYFGRARRDMWDWMAAKVVQLLQGKSAPSLVEAPEALTNSGRFYESSHWLKRRLVDVAVLLAIALVSWLLLRTFTFEPSHAITGAPHP